MRLEKARVFFLVSIIILFLLLQTEREKEKMKMNSISRVVVAYLLPIYIVK